MNLCGNGVYQFDGIHHSLKCNINNDNCIFIRWCVADSCLTMTNLADKCKYRGDVMVKKKQDEIEDIELTNKIEVNNKDGIKEEFIARQPKQKTETCRVLWSRNDKVAISFKGYGITIDGNTDQKTIEVKYESEIGSPEFKIIFNK